MASPDSVEEPLIPPPPAPASPRPAPVERLPLPHDYGKKKEEVEEGEDPTTMCTPNGKIRRWRHWFILSALVLVPLLFFAQWEAQRPMETPLSYGRMLVVEQEAVKYTRVPVAHLSCPYHLRNASAQWLHTGRRLNNESKRLTPFTRAHRAVRCLLPARGAVFTNNWTRFPVLDDMGGWDARDLVAPTLEARAFAVAAMNATVRVLFIDPAGDLWYRVLLARHLTTRDVLPNTTDGMVLHEVMVSHRALIGVLEAWRVDVLPAMRALDVRATPCICPGHLGIVGSGMHFISEPKDRDGNDRVFRRPDQLPATPPTEIWRVLLNMHVVQLPPTIETLPIELPFLTMLHAFPARVDHAILGESRAVSVVREDVWMAAQDATPFLTRAVVEQYDKAIAYEWRRAAEAGEGDEGDEEEEDGAEDVLALMIPLHATLRHTYTQSIASGAVKNCFFHCVAVDEALRGVRRQHEVARPPASAVAEDPRVTAQLEKLKKKKEQRARDYVPDSPTEEKEVQEEEMGEDL